jgi:hypothetical protein
MANPALEALKSRIEDAQRLITIHEESTGIAPGRRYDYDALNRSAVILSVAAWEGFVEDLLKYAVRRMATRLESAGDLPMSVRDVMLVKIHADHDWKTPNTGVKNALWSLAGSGWRSTYISYATSRIRGLNTPNAENVQKLYATVIGLKDFAADWGAKRWDRQTYVDKLDAALTLRHRIAHGTIGKETVGKTRARNAVNLIVRLAGWTTHSVADHLAGLGFRAKGYTSAAIKAALEELDRQTT